MGTVHALFWQIQRERAHFVRLRFQFVRSIKLTLFLGGHPSFDLSARLITMQTKAPILMIIFTLSCAYALPAAQEDFRDANCRRQTAGCIAERDTECLQAKGDPNSPWLCRWF
ncbi:hypothetical protein BC567DRAFT_209169 [Phyllosticta citribraziliensis]